jgi:PDZ domain-containing protein
MLPPDPHATGAPAAPVAAHDATIGVTIDGPSDPIDPGAPTPRELRRRRWLWAASAGLFVLCVAVGLSFIVKVPYYAFSAGSLYQTQEMILVEGPPTFPPEGDVLLTTISVSQERLTAFKAFVGWLDPTISVYEEKSIIGDADRETIREFNLQQMTSSQDVATYVALERLGYDVSISGTGAVVVGISPGSAAEGVLELGDTIVSLDGVPIDVPSDLVGAIGGQAPGDEVDLAIEPFEGGEPETVTVVLGAREDDPAAPLLGVEVRPRDGALVYPDGIEVEFDDRGIGGPSAGLAFTLTIVDMLTPGDLTGGREVAATGTMDIDGRVGPIGGIEQKAVTVKRAGVDVFLIPAGLAPAELEAARRQAGGDVELIEVASLDEALAALEALGGDPLVEVPAAA